MKENEIGLNSKKNDKIRDSSLKNSSIHSKNLGIEGSKKLLESCEMIGRRVQWNPESICTGAGSYGTIVGIQLNNWIKDGVPWIKLDDFYFLVAWDFNPNSSIGIHPENDILIIIQKDFKIGSNKKEVVLD